MGSCGHGHLHSGTEMEAPFLVWTRQESEPNDARWRPKATRRPSSVRASTAAWSWAGLCTSRTPHGALREAPDIPATQGRIARTSHLAFLSPPHLPLCGTQGQKVLPAPWPASQLCVLLDPCWGQESRATSLAPGLGPLWELHRCPQWVRWRVGPLPILQAALTRAARPGRLSSSAGEMLSLPNSR